MAWPAGYLNLREAVASFVVLFYSSHISLVCSVVSHANHVNLSFPPIQIHFEKASSTLLDGA